MYTKAFKRSLNQPDNHYRKGFGHEAEVAGVLNTEYQSNLIQNHQQLYQKYLHNIKLNYVCLILIKTYYHQ